MSTSRNRTAVVTGSAAGIGQEYARRLAEIGHRVVLADVADMTETQALIEAAGGETISVTCDVASPDSILALRDAADRFGGADILIHNAGIYPIARFEDIDLDQWRRVQTINVEALFLLCQAFLPTMRARQWGRIVGIASGMFAIGAPGGVHYVASKGAVTGLVRGLAPEVGTDGITVNVISPGLIRTPGTSTGTHDSLGLFDSITELQDIKRTGLPTDLSSALLFLVSEDAGFITGQTLLIDGGVGRT
jgi:NAD(P)-dependent dehydrogenase (short-subunit alcohol dehydrogenase family)